MQYLGGKARIGKDLAQYINNRLLPKQPYWEPFLGAGWVMFQIDKNRIRMGSDIHKELMCMWTALQKGWEPPKNINEEEYYQIKSEEDDKLKGFVGFACSWGGKWWGGYARDNNDRNYCQNGYNSVTRKIKRMNDVQFFVANYKTITPLYKSLIYCDPPYSGTTEYKNKFYSEEFWVWCRKMSIAGNTVLISEYTAPDDFIVVWERETKTDLRVKCGSKSTRVEKLFEYKAIK